MDEFSDKGIKVGDLVKIECPTHWGHEEKPRGLWRVEAFLVRANNCVLCAKVDEFLERTHKTITVPAKYLVPSGRTQPTEGR